MIETVQSTSQIAASALIAALWQGVVLTAAIWLCLKLAPRAAAGLRFAVWMAVFAAIALLPLMAIFPGQASAVSAAPSAGAIHPLQLDPRWALGIAAVWALVAAARLIGLGRNALRLGSIWSRSTPLTATPAVQALLNQAAVRRPLLCASSGVDQPCVIGFFAPRILVPGWLLEKATEAELEQIVLHELAHLRRFDDWTNLFQKLVVALFPLNPALLWVERRLCAERELACDERVVSATKAPRAYATCLANLAGQRIARREMALSGALSLGAWERRSQLGARIESILRGGRQLSPLKARAILAALLVATAAGAGKLSHSVQLVSFAAPDASAAEAQVGPQVAAGVRDRYALSHPALDAAPAVHPELVSSRTVSSAKRPRARTMAKTTLRRQEPSPAAVQTFFVVTRWRNSSGQQMTVVDRFVRISALPAAQAQAGWFFVQL
jgi:beta-lactamase regulating signal transducer with metallopeptidase domain